MSSRTASLTDPDVTNEEISEIFENETGIRMDDATRLLKTVEDSFGFIPDSIDNVSQKIKTSPNETKYSLECVIFGEYNWDIGEINDESIDKHSLLMQKYYFRLLLSFSKYPLLKHLRLWRNPVYPDTMKFISQLFTDHDYSNNTQKSKDKIKTTNETTTDATTNTTNKNTIVFDFLGLRQTEHKCECKLELIDLTFSTITDGCIPYLCQIIDFHCKSLKHILLGNNHITDKGLVLLCQSIKKCDNLETVDVSLQIQQEDEYDYASENDDNDTEKNIVTDNNDNSNDVNNKNSNTTQDTDCTDNDNKPNGHLIGIYHEILDNSNKNNHMREDNTVTNSLPVLEALIGKKKLKYLSLMYNQLIPGDMMAEIMYQLSILSDDTLHNLSHHFQILWDTKLSKKFHISNVTYVSDKDKNSINILNGQGESHANQSSFINRSGINQLLSFDSETKFEEMTDSEINKFIDECYLKICELYGWHFPELLRIVNKNDSFLYCSCVIKIGNRNQFLNDNPNITQFEMKFNNIRDKSKEIIIKVDRDLISMSMGVDVSDQDMQIVFSLCNNLLMAWSALYTQKQKGNVKIKQNDQTVDKNHTTKNTHNVEMKTKHKDELEVNTEMEEIKSGMNILVRLERVFSDFFSTCINLHNLELQGVGIGKSCYFLLYCILNGIMEKGKVLYKYWSQSRIDSIKQIINVDIPPGIMSIIGEYCIDFLEPIFEHPDDHVGSDFGPLRMSLSRNLIGGDHAIWKIPKLANDKSNDHNEDDNDDDNHDNADNDNNNALIEKDTYNDEVKVQDRSNDGKESIVAEIKRIELINKIEKENIYNTMTVLYEALESKYCLIGKLDIDDMFTFSQIKEISHRMTCNPIYYGSYFSIAAQSNAGKVSNSWFDEMNDFIKNERNLIDKNRYNKNKNRNKRYRSNNNKKIIKGKAASGKDARSEYARDEDTLLGYDITGNNFSGFRASIIRNDVWTVRWSAFTEIGHRCVSHH